MEILSKVTNVVNSWGSKQRKGLSLSANHDGHMSIKNTNIPPNFKFTNTDIGKTMQDYGNTKTQVIRSS